MYDVFWIWIWWQLGFGFGFDGDWFWIWWRLVWFWFSPIWIWYYPFHDFTLIQSALALMLFQFRWWTERHLTDAIKSNRCWRFDETTDRCQVPICVRFVRRASGLFDVHQVQSKGIRFTDNLKCRPQWESQVGRLSSGRIEADCASSQSTLCEWICQKPRSTSIRKYVE